MKRNKKGFTLVELVIVIAVIAILAGIMVAIFSGVIKRANESAELQQVKNDELKQKADDVLTKLENANWFSWEDFENSLATKLTDAYKKYGADTEKIVEQVNKAVKSAIDEYAANSATSNTSLTEAQVKAIVENALASAKLGGVTEAQVRTIVNTAVDGITTLSKSDVQKIVDAATAKGLTADQVASVIGQSKLAKKSDTDAISAKVDAAIAAINALKPVTNKDIEDKIIDLLPVTKSATSATEFTTLVGRLNSGSTIVVDFDATEPLAIDATAGDKTLTISGKKIGTLNINAPKATVYLMCDVDNVNVVETAKNSLHILGKVTTLKINSGRVVLESGSSVANLTAAPSESKWVTVEIEESAAITGALTAEYQKHKSATYDYIEIVNKGEIKTTKLTLATETQGTAVTTNVVITNVNEAKSGKAGDPSQSTLNVVSEIADEVGLAVDGTNYTVLIQGTTSVIKPDTAPIPVQNGVAMIGSVVFDNVYDALERVPYDETETLITLIGDCGITSNAGYTVNAKQNIVLDLNGHVLGSLAEEENTSALITNKGTLTIKDSTDTAKNGSGKGKLTASATNPDRQDIPGYANNTITNNGVLTLESGTIENEGPSWACYCVDNNSTSSDVLFTMFGGRLYNGGTDCVRLFCNSTKYTSKVTINGGVIERSSTSSRVIWLHLPSSSNIAQKGIIEINDGEIKGVVASYSFTNGANGCITDVQTTEVKVTINGGFFENTISCECYEPGDSVTTIKGGTFKDITTRWGYRDLAENGDRYWFNYTSGEGSTHKGTTFSGYTGTNDIEEFKAWFSSSEDWEGYSLEFDSNYMNIMYPIIWDIEINLAEGYKIQSNGNGTVTVVPEN